MVPIGDKEKPLLEYVVRLLTHHGFRDIILLTNYRANQITNYFNEGPRFNAHFRFIQDIKDVTGTGGALLNARDELQDNFIIYYGDILSSIDLSKMWKKHIENDAACTVALAKDFPVRVGVADLSTEGDLKGFVEKPMLGRPVAIGIFALNLRAVDIIEEIEAEKRKDGKAPAVDLTGELIPILIERGEKVQAYLTDSFWYDVGSLERYEKLENHVVEKELSYLLE
jgi:mannose-1-phosphate guanylyltransferase